MSILSKIKPQFWDHPDTDPGTGERPFSFRRKWALIVMFATAASLIPLLVMTAMDYRLSRRTFESQAELATTRMVSITWRAVSFLLSERRSVLEFVAGDNSKQALEFPGRLEAILENLRNGIGGFVDIGIVDSGGETTAYAGPYEFENAGCRNARCFEEAVEKGAFVSDAPVGEKGERRLIAAVRRDMENGDYFVLRSVLERELLFDPVSRARIAEGDDAFVVDGDGLLQTPSRYFGKVYEKVPFELTPEREGTRIAELPGPSGQRMLAGYAGIPGTDFVFMILRPKSGLMELWLKPRMKLLWFLAFSIFLILATIIGMATYLVGRIHAAEQRRTRAFREAEYENKLASLGRLASGVAHEINNPLAIVGQKVGLVKDLFGLRPEYSADEKLLGLIDDAMKSIERCGTITRRLLDLSTHMESSMETVNIENIVRQVLGFMKWESKIRCIEMNVEIDEDVPEFVCDPGLLQQVFSNLVNHAFKAMEVGGILEVFVKKPNNGRVILSVSDTGPGIPKEDLERIFEPFYSFDSGSKQNGDYGLGLSITYNLVKKMGGELSVESEVGKGARFVVALPVNSDANQ